MIESVAAPLHAAQHILDDLGGQMARGEAGTTNDVRRLLRSVVELFGAAENEQRRIADEMLG